MFEHFIDSLFDGTERQETRHGHGSRDTDAMRSIDRLILHGGVPPAVEQENIVGELQV